MLHQYGSRTRAAIHPYAVQVLSACRDWQRIDQIVAALPNLPAPWIRQAVTRLARASFLQRSDRAVSRAQRQYDGWRDWSPAAAFFHFSTRDPEWVTPAQREVVEASLRSKGRRQPPPSPVKSQRGLPAFELPAPDTAGEFPGVLLARRTWRGFSSGALELSDVSTLLWLTAGVQRWGRSSAGERVAFKTSPSAGCKHPIELYVLAQKVKGLTPGIYHYAGDRHRLARISKGLSPSRVERYLGHQWQFKNAPAVILMTAVMARTQWTYPTPRAYRSVLAEAGHVCQTLCLTATWLDLAPFCTMAIADADVEKALKIDGVSEVALYAAGVGRKPKDGRWVQWPRHAAGKPYTPPPG